MYTQNHIGGSDEAVHLGLDGSIRIKLAESGGSVILFNVLADFVMNGFQRFLFVELLLLPRLEEGRLLRFGLTRIQLIKSGQFFIFLLHEEDIFADGEVRLPDLHPLAVEQGHAGFSKLQDIIGDGQ